MKLIKAFWIILALLTVNPVFASETRVDSMGGLTSVVEDETDNLDLFLDGNPAGLVLLKTKDRFDINGQWDYANSQPSGPGSVAQSFSTISRLSTDGIIRYGGLMIFTQPWAYQIDSDLITSQNLLASGYLAEPFNAQQYRQLVRTAFNAGPFSLGLEISNIENDQTFNTGLYSAAVSVQSGSAAQNQTRVRTGIITTFPDGLEDSDPRWQVGFVFETYLGQVMNSLNNNLFYTSQFSLQQNTATTNYYYFGPELHYEVPGTFLIRFSSFMSNYDTGFNQTVSQTNAYFTNSTSAHSSQYQAMTNVGAFRLTLPTSDKENFKLGGSLTAYLTNNDLVGSGSAQSVYNTSNKQQIDGVLGVGFEAANDYFLGVQFKTQNYITDVESGITSTAASKSTDFDYYQAAIGGEKWLSSQFALRASVIEEWDLYTQSVNASWLDSSATIGFGWKDKGLLLDTKFLIGDWINLNDSTISTFVLNAEITGTFFL
ncbi:MAG TPA: hypothetical protein VK791_09630 [bacterium]|jgi:hypothetical protein|nr:hypothetical protein [bacterium]